MIAYKKVTDEEWNIINENEKSRKNFEKIPDKLTMIGIFGL